MNCSDCGYVVRGSSLGGSAGSWIARETLAGRVSTLSRARKSLLAGGVVVVLGCFVAAVALLTGSDAGSEARADDDIAGRGIPTRLGPTSLPDPDDSGEDFEEWAGPGCPTGRYHERGRFENGRAAWYTVPSGGRREGGCDGSFSAVPMSGSPDHDRGSTATWVWDLDARYAQCSLAVFVPRTTHATDTAGDPTVYRVLADPDDPGSAYTAFGVRQTVHRGELVAVGSYPVKGGATFAVQLVDRGRDWGRAARVGAHHAAAQMLLVCRA
ncbi:adhesin [Streptomyces sp. NPDC007861]|uniref:adhesin n=1 Tax=Streptomyces sp. NPDC007861 TaxID=3154893 RepID=UPI0033C69D70